MYVHVYMYICNDAESSKFFTQTATDPSCNRRKDYTSVPGMYAVTFVCTCPSVDRAPPSHGETPLYPQCGCLNEEGRGGMWEEEKRGRGGGREVGERREEGKRGDEGEREEGERREEGKWGRGGRKGQGRRGRKGRGGEEGGREKGERREEGKRGDEGGREEGERREEGKRRNVGGREEGRRGRDSSVMYVVCTT